MLQLCRLHTCGTTLGTPDPKGAGLPTAAGRTGCTDSGEPAGSDDRPSGGGALGRGEGPS
jgi:hypothetical protein